MIRPLLILWLGPNAFFWSWYYLSLNDISFGMLFFSRALHDQVFALYGGILGVDPAAIPGMVARALGFDSVIVLAIIAWRQRRSWLPRLSSASPARRSSSASLSADSLSSAP